MVLLFLAKVKNKKIHEYEELLQEQEPGLPNHF